MRQRNLLAGAILSMGLLPACVVGDAALTVRRTEVETRAIEPGGTFHLRNVNGHVSVASGGERQVRIETEKAANSQGALDEVEIAIAGQGDRVEVRTRTPQRRWTLFGPRVRVNYRITLPESAHVDIETVNGSIHVSRLKGPVRAAVVNGGIRVEGAAGAVDARTVNGSIDASYGAVVGEGSHRFATTNGSVSVRLPENTRDYYDRPAAGRPGPFWGEASRRKTWRRRRPLRDPHRQRLDCGQEDLSAAGTIPAVRWILPSAASCAGSRSSRAWGRAPDAAGAGCV
jgi:hypothetical protein